jgi:serralysin
MARAKSVDTISKNNKLNKEVDRLLSGKNWTDDEISYSFPTVAADYEKNYGSETRNGVTPLAPLEQDAFELIFDNIEAVTGLTFVESPIAKNATIRLAKSDLSNAEAWAYYPSTTPKGGDAWFDIFEVSLTESFAAGSRNYTLFMHELGHSLGLKHSGASLEYTVMSLSSHEGAADWDAEDANFPQTLMMYDIAALQHIYGANLDTNDGDTTYRWDPGTGVLSTDDSIDGVVVVPDAPGNTIFMTVWDGGGVDTFDFSNYDTADTPGMKVDLRPGGWTIVDPDQLADLDGVPGNVVADGNIAVALESIGPNGEIIAQYIENVIGSAAADQITGNGVANVLTGGGGNDTLVFWPAFGLDQVTDFDDAGDDTIVFSTAVFADWTAVENAMSVSGADVVITLDAINKVTLVGTTLASMTESDFTFVTVT